MDRSASLRAVRRACLASIILAAGLALPAHARTATADLLERCHAAQIPAQPVRDLAGIMQDPQLAATGFFTRVDHPTEGSCHMMRDPVRFGCAINPPPGAAPTLGHHDEEARAT